MTEPERVLIEGLRPLRDALIASSSLIAVTLLYCFRDHTDPAHADLDWHVDTVVAVRRKLAYLHDALQD